MKKQWIKRIFSAGLALMLAAGQCACGSSAEGKSLGGGNRNGISADSDAHTVNDMDSVNIPGNANAGTNTNANTNTNAKSALAKENVYRVSEVEIPDSDNVMVESTAHFDGIIYAVLLVYDWENGHKYFVLSMDESGNNLQTVFLELPGYGERKKTAEPDPNVWEREEARYSDFVFGPDGRTYALRRYEYTYVNYLTDQYVGEQHRYVCCWDTDGSLLWQTEPCEDDTEDLDVWAIIPAADGSLELLLTGENMYRLPVARDGSLSRADKEKLSETTGKALRNCRRLIRKEDGSCLLLCRDAEEGLSLMKYDLQTDTLGEACRLPDDHLSATYLNLKDVVFSADAGSGLVYADKTGVYTYDMGEAQAGLKMDYVNSDRNITDIFSLLELDDTHFVMFYREDYIHELKAGIFEYVKPEDIPDREVVILGGIYINGGIKKRAIQYNRESDKYKILLKEYGSCEELNLDIVSGKMPDILMAQGLPNGESIPMRSYIAKGLIADVGMLIEEDGELSRAEFLENVFDAYSDNLMALSAVSENMDGAWDFARYYLTDEYQESLDYRLPVVRRIFEERAVEATLRPYHIDENGEKVEYDERLKTPDGEVVVVPPLDREQLDQLIAYVESVTATPYEDSNVLSIIEEELGSYFSGQKTAESVAAIIQSRVQMYVQENQ